MYDIKTFSESISILFNIYLVFSLSCGILFILAIDRFKISEWIKDYLKDKNLKFSTAAGSLAIDRQIEMQTKGPATEPEINKEDLPTKIADARVVEDTLPLVNKDKEIEMLKKEVLMRDVFLDYERMYTDLFGSQIGLIEYIKNVGSVGVDFIAKYFSEVQVKDRPILDTWNFANYINYPLRRGLLKQVISQDGMEERYEVTPYGDGFLKYLKDSAYNFNKPL